MIMKKNEREKKKSFDKQLGKKKRQQNGKSEKSFIGI
jgi:hypothetical protein